MATGITSKNGRVFEPIELAYESKLSKDEILLLPKIQPFSLKEVGEENRLYQGDNLGLMLSLLDDKEIRGHVRCVYIDPPFATQMAFVDRDLHHAYDDRLDGGAFIEFLRRRLTIIRELMAEDASIFVHLDQNMMCEIKLIMDEVFGRKNFRNLITRKKCNTKNYTKNVFGNVSDHILFYGKTGRYVWNRPYDQWTEDKFLREYQYVDNKTGRRYKKVPVHAPGVRRGATGRQWRGMMPPPGKHWQYTPERLDAFDKAGEIYWSPTGNPRRKVFFDSRKGIPVQDIWFDFKDAHNQNIKITGFPTEKNYDLLKRIVAATSNKGDWVMDCFCGSGTTLEAARDLGRKFIGMDNSDAAIRATVKRLKLGRKPMGDFVRLRNVQQKRSAQLELFHVG